MMSSPAAVIVSSNKSFWALKSGWLSITLRPQQLSVSPHLPRQSKRRFLVLRLRSFRRIFMPYSTPARRWYAGSTMDCDVPSPNIPFRITGCFPPGPKFIRWDTRASSANATWLVPFSKAKKAFAWGNWASKMVIAASRTCLWRSSEVY